MASIARRLVIRRGRHVHGRWEGRWYRVTQHGPDPLVGDDVLADRVRSALGSVAKRAGWPLRRRAWKEVCRGEWQGRWPEVPDRQGAQPYGRPR